MRPPTRLGNAVSVNSDAVIMAMCGFLIEGFGGLLLKMWRQYVPPVARRRVICYGPIQALPQRRFCDAGRTPDDP
jgi:hypothetical protein